VRGPRQVRFDQMWLISDTTAKVFIVVTLALGLAVMMT
jgi:hypothetical protein